ncbi:RHS repeat-associated core domain-containing protein, partial [Chryseobacterium aquaticum]|nr:RHS repeat-associated core domain-containing protein [Chryseobacterium aquaticum]NRQ48203.1 RHS repeat-associated core domain-containing protein [Chryseobacterium sp. C-204]
PNNEAKSTSSFNHSGMDIYYSNSAFPTNIIKILSVNYYDTYPTGTPAIPVEILGKPVLSQDSQNSNISTKSLPTASYVKNIENDNWTMNYTWYDTKGRAIGSHSINHLGGFTKTESELDFAGAVKKINTYHSRNTQSTEVTIQENFTYDSQNRLLTHTHQVNSNPVEVLAENEYNEIGQITNKRIGNGLQKAEYDYNIRGWMTGINKKKLTPNGMDGRLFAYDIRYENPTISDVSPAKFNGNISEVNWMVSSNQKHKRYAYNYDQLNRLRRATFLNPNSTTPLNHMNDEIIDYDLNGNIIYLKRNAAPFAGTTPDMIDNLYYAYNGNQLISIDDTSNNPTGYEGGGGTMQYDTNGNMISMPDKQINQIGYNFLNLPNALNIENTKKKLFHLYRADGSKLKKIFNYLKDDGNTFTTITEYLDGFQYLTTMGTAPNEFDPMEYAYEQEAFIEKILQEEPIAALQFFPTAEGFYDYENNQYIYQYKDHLGNVRVSYKKGTDGLPEITDQNDYYPFGMNIPREEKAIVGLASLYNYK